MVWLVEGTEIEGMRKKKDECELVINKMRIKVVWLRNITRNKKERSKKNEYK